MEILTLFACFETLTALTSGRQLAVIAEAILTMSGRVTMLSISRWTSKGGSYRTVQRFFATDLPWVELLVKFFQTHLFDSESEFILAGDATTVTKSGSANARNRAFFSGILSQVVSGLEFFVISLVDVAERRAYPLAARANGAERGGKKGAQGAEKEAGEEVEKDENETERMEKREFE